MRTLRCFALSMYFPSDGLRLVMVFFSRLFSLHLSFPSLALCSFAWASGESCGFRVIIYLLNCHWERHLLQHCFSIYLSITSCSSFDSVERSLRSKLCLLETFSGNQSWVCGKYEEVLLCSAVSLFRSLVNMRTHLFLLHHKTWWWKKRFQGTLQLHYVASF